MGTQSRLSILVECLLISTLLLSLSFAPCNATSRGMESMAAADPMATSCRGRDCSSAAVEQEHRQGMMMHSKWTHMSSMDPAAAKEAQISDPRMADHGRSDWVRGSESKSMMDRTERLRDPNMVREGLQDSDSIMRGWTRESADRQRDLNNERMRNSAADKMGASDHERRRDFESSELSSEMGSPRGEDSHCLSNSERMSSHCMESSRLDNSQRMRDSDRMIDSEGMRDSDRMRDADRKIDSHGMNERMRDSHTMLDSGRMSDSERMTGSNTIRDKSENEMNSGQRSTDHQGAAQNRDDSDLMGSNSDRMWGSQGRRDLENTRVAHNMMDSSAAERRTRLGADREKENGSEMMGDAEKMNNLSNRRGDLERRRDLDAVRHSDSMQEGAEEQMSTNSHDGLSHSDADHSRTLAHIERQQSSRIQRNSCHGIHCHSNGDLMGEAQQMRTEFNRRGDLERSPRDSENNMRNSDSILQGSEQMINTNSQKMKISAAAAAAGSRMGHMERQPQSTVNPSSCHGTDCRSNSNLMGDAHQMNGLSRRGDLERRRDMDAMRFNSDNMQSEGSEQMGTTSQRVTNSADQSRMEHMAQMHHQATMDPSSCHGTHCRSTSDGEVMQRLSSRHLNAEIIGSQADNHDSKRIDSSSTADRCTGKNPASHCDFADQIDGEPRGAQQMDHMSQRDHGALSNSCRFNGADCQVTPASSDLQGSQKMDHMMPQTEAQQSSSCRLNGGDCHVTPDRETSNAQTAESGICSDDFCPHSIPNSEETMATMTNSERMHRTRNDREIATSPKLERSTATITGTRMSGNSEEVSHMAEHPEMTGPHSQKMRSADSQTMQISREGSLGAMDDAETRSSRMQPGSEMAHDSTSNHWNAAAEITHPSSCSNEANCQRTSEIMHMSSRDSEIMGHGDQSDIANTGWKKDLGNGDLTTMDQVSISAQARSDSTVMRNPDEANADNLPMIHGRNY